MLRLGADRQADGASGRVARVVELDLQNRGEGAGEVLQRHRGQRFGDQDVAGNSDAEQWAPAMTRAGCGGPLPRSMPAMNSSSRRVAWREPMAPRASARRVGPVPSASHSPR
jgi:hypothetical protein